MKDELIKVYNQVRATPKLSDDYKDVSYDRFKSVLTKDPEARKLLYEDLVDFKLVDPAKSPDPDTYWGKWGVVEPKAPKVSLAPPTPTNPSSQTASQIAGKPINVQQRPITPEPTLREQMGGLLGIDTKAKQAPAKLEPSKLESYASDIYKSVRRGLAQGEAIQQTKLFDLATGDASKLDFNAMAKANAEVKAIGQTATEQDFQKSDGVWDDITDYAKMTIPVVAESVFSLGRSGWDEALVGGGLGAIMTGGRGAGSGAQAGLSVAAYQMELYSSVMDELESKGINTSDPNALRNAFNDKALMSDVLKTANTRATAIAATDLAFGAGIGKVLKAFTPKTVVGKAIQKVGQKALDSEIVGGMTGEALAQVSTKGKINAQEVVLEGLGGAANIAEIKSAGRNLNKVVGTAKEIVAEMKRPKLANSIEDVPVASQESAVVTEDGKVIYDETNVEVTPEEFQAYQEGVLNEDRKRGLDDDIAKGVTPESVEEADPLYARMLAAEYAKQQTTAPTQDNAPSQTETAAIKEDEEAPISMEDQPLDLDAELAALEGLQMEDEEAAPGFDEGIPPIKISLPAIEVRHGPSSFEVAHPFDVALKKLGYTDDEISGMTTEQKQDILIKKTEPARAESSAKVDSVKENERQEKIAKAFAALEEESVPLSDEAGQNVDVVDAGQEVDASGGEPVATEPGRPQDQGEVVQGVPEPIKYDWDYVFTEGPAKGQRLSEQKIEVIGVYDDSSVDLNFGENGNILSPQKEAKGLLSITKSPVKVFAIFDNREGDAISNANDQKLIRRIAAIAAAAGKVVVKNPQTDRANKKTPLLLVSPEDAVNYEVDSRFQGKLDTPKQTMQKTIVKEAIDSGSYEKQIKEGKRSAREVIETIKASGLSIPESILALDQPIVKPTPASLTKGEGKEKPIDKKAVESLLTKAKDELSAAQTAFDKKKAELNKTTKEDATDLFGNRKVEEGGQSLFEIPRINPAQREKVIQPFRDRLDKAKAEVNRLTSLLNEGKEITQELNFGNDEQVQPASEKVRQRKSPTTDEIVVRKKVAPVRNAGRSADAIAARNVELLGDPFYSSLQYVMDITYHPDLLQAIFGGPDRNSKSGRKSIEGERKPRIQFLDKKSDIKTSDRLGELLAEHYAEINGMDVRRASEKHDFTSIAEEIISNYTTRSQMVQDVLKRNDQSQDIYSFMYDPADIYGPGYNEDVAKDVDVALDDIPDSYWEGMELTDEQYNELFAPGGVIQDFDAAQSLKGEEGRAARKALRESMGKPKYKDAETITNKFDSIAKDLEARGVWKIDCP